MTSAVHSASKIHPSKSDPLEDALVRATARLVRVPTPARVWAEAFRELTMRPGKRVRPWLCVLAYEGVARAPATEAVLDFAAGLELLHAFMLVHDDLIDGADVRRGAPSLHRALEPEHGAQASALALLGGDALFVAAVDAMVRAVLPADRLREALAVVLEGARQAAVGEMLDVSYAQQPLTSLSSARLADVLRLKTAGYTFVAPLVAGATLAGANASTRRALTQFGQRVGLAFQLADDLLDVYGDADRLGKPVGGDLREGKRTVFARLVAGRALTDDATRFVSLLDGRAANAEDLEWVRDLGRRTGVASELASRVRTFIAAGERCLSRAELEPGAAEQLRALARKVVTSVAFLEDGHA
jgi:geranylgeranyl diphosphate synthase type I